MSALQSDWDRTHSPGRIVPNVSRVLYETRELFTEIQLNLPQDSHLQYLTHKEWRILYTLSNSSQHTWIIIISWLVGMSSSVALLYSTLCFFLTLSASGWNLEHRSDRKCRASVLKRVSNSFWSPGGGCSTSTLYGTCVPEWLNLLNLGQKHEAYLNLFFFFFKLEWIILNLKNTNNPL